MVRRASLIPFALLFAAPVFAQTRLDSVNGPGPTFIAPYNNPRATNYGTFYPGYPVYNQYANPYGYGYPYSSYGVPVYGVPVFQPGPGLFQFRVGNVGLNMWRSPSGYYYPWCGLPQGYAYSNTTILYAPQQNTAAQPQLPPISTMVKDMLTYLDEAKSKGKLSDSDYQHLKRRATDLQSKADSLMSAGGGQLDPHDEQSIRADLNQVGGEISVRSNRN